jgi:chemotaxis protein MotB
MKLADFEQMAAVLRGNKQAEKTPLDEVQAQLVQSLNASALKDAVDVTQQDHSLILDIKDKVLFDSGQYHLSKNGLDLLKIISTSLKHIPTTYRLGVEGHTDDIPIHVPGISDNWELSAKRAHSVLISLDLEDNLKRRSVVMGFGEMEPLFPNRDGDGNPLPANRAKNRRVTLRVF